jgi:riboflavin biosynthesis pyrimidine reductase
MTTGASTSSRLDRIWPNPADDVTDAELVAELDHPVVRLNFVSSVDGAATKDGLSGGLSGSADKRRFELLRRIADVVLVGAGTVRSEGYTAMRVTEESVAWRLSQGRSAHPVFAIVTASLDFDVASPLFTEAPERPLLVTASASSGRDRFSGLADVLVAGGGRVEVEQAVAVLRERGLDRILCEGGPTLFGDLLAADVADELCLTLAPTLESGTATRIAHGPEAHRPLTLRSVYRGGDEVLLRYTRAALAPSPG